MKKNAMRRNLRQSIINSFGRYIAIVAIIALGAALFVGLLMTKQDMVATGQSFMDAQKMFDLRIMNSYGWTDAYLEEIAAMEGVVEAGNVTYLDLIATVGEAETEEVYRFLELPQTLNQVALRGGRMPENAGECLADGFYFGDKILGQTVTISRSNDEDSLESVNCETFTVVGYIATPLYMDMNRGTTNVGSGSLESFFYVPEGALDLEYHAEINITIDGDDGIYTEEYMDAVTAVSDALEPQLQNLADRRLAEVREEAKEAFYDGLEEYADGLMEFAEGRDEAMGKLNDAYQELMDGQKELEEGEQQLIDGEKQIEEAKQALLAAEKTLQDSIATLDATKAAAYKQISESTQAMAMQMQSLSEELAPKQDELLALGQDVLELNYSIIPLEVELALMNSSAAQTQSMINVTGLSIEAARQALELAEQSGEVSEDILAQMRQEIADMEADLVKHQQTYAQQQSEIAEVQAQLDELNAQLDALISQQNALQESINLLESAISSITSGILEMTITQSVMESEFAAAEAQIGAGEAQIEAGYLEIELQEKNIADGWVTLEESKAELADGWKEYEEGKAEAEQELADALQEIRDAGVEISDAWDTIQGMTDNEIILLDRSSNVGYNNLESSSDIVQGVSRVIPVFFILVASLVCITTMTRMIDEERTQIGTLKALGYSNSAIIGKYLMYSGSGAVIGCGMGVVLGNTIFPMILWQAYCILLYIQPNIVLTVNWALLIGVVAMYTGVMLAVTWYCCHRTLQEEPAELIRPKSPEAGKKILMEYLPFWHKISFLNKVTIRNIFRYRQRLAMMMVGIGGCTALLVTGFGLRDSIMNVVDYQFQEVSTYDMIVYFTEGLTQDQQKDFLKEIEDANEDTMFFHQSSVDVEFSGSTKEIYLVAADELEGFMDLHKDDEALSMPGVNQVVLSSGVAENMGIDTGDTITLRNADMKSMDVTVSAVYDNHVYNYAIVLPQTLESKWNEVPQQQMAFVKVLKDQDVHQLGARISELDNVMNVTVSEDVAEMVGGMLEALDLVVIVIVFCAGLLAVIVLYNLTNININERIREIATIKVLGFNASETAAYVFKENLTLTVAGSIVGLGLGYLMLLFVMSQIRIDMVWFKALVELKSYVWSALMTVLSAVVVDFIFYFKLDKINMAEALKSVE